jgi:PilZ domain
MLDISLGGCRVRTVDRFLAGIMARVEVVFTLRGVNFRLPGVTQWTDRRNLVGIRFLDMTSRRTEALAESLAEIDASPLP